jgi:hypothetical protein
VSNRVNHRQRGRAERRTEHGPRYENPNPGKGSNATNIARSRTAWKRIRARHERRTTRSTMRPPKDDAEINARNCLACYEKGYRTAAKGKRADPLFAEHSNQEMAAAYAQGMNDAELDRGERFRAAAERWGIDLEASILRSVGGDGVQIDTRIGGDPDEH